MNDIIFDKDIFLETDFPVALDSPDHINPFGGTQQDFTNGQEFAEYLLKLYPSKRTLIDLGTATGTVPMTMRQAGILAVGLEGSDMSQQKKLGAWGIMPEILKTCDISRPFWIVDDVGELFKFDYVTSWGVFEHIHPERMDMLWENIRNLMHEGSIGIFNIDLGCNEFHQSGGVPKEEWQRRLEGHFELMREMTFDDEGNFREHPYCRPSWGEREYIRREGLRFDSGRTFWWVRLGDQAKAL